MFLGVAIGSLVVPSTQMKWYILSSSIVPTMMNAGMSPTFAQIVYRFAETSVMNITPILSYFVVYIAFLEKYNRTDKKIKLIDSLKYQLPYTSLVVVTLLVLVIVWYIIGLPLGIKAFPTV